VIEEKVSKSKNLKTIRSSKSTLLHYLLPVRILCICIAILLLAVTVGTAEELTLEEELGKNLFFDKISEPDRMSCATCHAPETGFTGPITGINKHGAVYRGAVPQRFGNRKPPSAAYATLSPIFHYDEDEGLFVGGNFWDGRATGEILGNPAADQALGPFLNPVEQNNPDKKAVLEQIAASKYAWLWEVVWNEPISYETQDDIDENYNRVGLAIAAYEGSSEVNQFSSKYDAYLAELTDLTEEEALGLTLFNAPNDNDGIKEEGEGGNCAACHLSQPENGNPPLFTDFTFDNLGIPRNPDNPFYDMDTVFLDDGSPINPEGDAWVDPGLGGFLENAGYESDVYELELGKHKVPTLRNVDKRPGNGFPKAYGHNGYFKSLEGIVHFYNTMDVLDDCPDPFTTEKDALKMNCWPEPEIPETVNTEELGDLGLSAEEERAIVSFMKTLTDGYTP
jgi:cytochrome c peroxidase